MDSKPRLQIRIRGPEGTRLETLEKEQIFIGRSVQCELIVSNVEVSRRHVLVEIDGDLAKVTDQGSKNGSFINGKKLEANVPTIWKVGESLKLGLAPEELILEPVASAAKGDAPPPVESVVRNQIPVPNLKISIPQSGPQPLVKPAVAEPQDPSSNSLWLGSEDSKPGGGESGASLLGDLEKRMNELIKKAQADAKSLINTAEVPSGFVTPKEPKPAAIIIPPVPAISEESSEKIEKQVQLKDLDQEIATRTDDRRELAREAAQTLLKKQQMTEEIERLKVARSQLLPDLERELASLEAKIEKAKEEADHLTASSKDELQGQAKEVLEKAKKQAELLLKEAEIKAKEQREKLKVQLADERRLAELELADLKLKQVAEIKDSDESFEKKWEGRKAELSKGFLKDVRSRLESFGQESGIDVKTKLKFVTTIEESLHEHFLNGPTGYDQQKNFQSEDSESYAPAEDTLVPNEEKPPLVPRFPLQVIGVVGTVVVLLASGWIWRGSRIKQRASSSQMASARQQAAPKPAAAPVPVPVPAPAPLSAPVQALQVEVVAMDPSPQSPPASGGDLVDQVQASSQVESVNVQRQPSAKVEEKDKSKAKAKPKAARPTATWDEVLSGSRANEWRIKSADFMFKQLRLDRARIARYQKLEAELSRGLASKKGRSLASVKSRRKIEAQFARDASRVLGGANWAKLLTLRNSFMGKNR